MNWFRDLAIGRKLTLVMMLASGTAVLLAGITTIVYEVAAFRRVILQDLSVQADIIGGNCAAALEFDNPRTAQETLGSLQARIDIVAACVYRKDGSILASYVAEGSASAAKFPPPEADSYRREGRHLALFHRIVRRGERLGTVYLRSNVRPHYTRLSASIAIVLSAMLVACLLALALAARLQRVISGPILDVAGLAERVTNEHDYSLRATKRGNDEIGALTDGFNRMLENIQERDAKLQRAYGELQSSEHRFRQLAEAISEVFWMTDLAKTEMIYISPGYETIWGRTCSSLYQNPLSWLEAIHPGDRERVTQAALTRQAGGQYDEEYRIVRPDGSIRWIRDRAFPIRDQDGNVYRIAGVARDITERKRLEKEVLEVSDREQARIGQDLHDGLAQHLVATAFAVGPLERRLQDKSPAEAAELHQIGELIDQAITEARHVARGLHPVKLEEAGLCAALEELSAALGNRFNVECRLDCPEPVRVSDNAVATHVYRIAQEAANNGIIHGRATRIVLKLRVHPDRLTLRAYPKTPMDVIWW